MSEIHFDDATHTYTVDGKVVPSVTQILHDLGLADAMHYTQEAAERGSAVHEAVRMIEAGILHLESFRQDTVLYPYLMAWHSFREQSGFIVKETETIRFHETMRYAGTIDLLAEYKGKCLIDIKSGSIMPWHGLQLAGYAEMEEGVKHRYILELRNDGKWSLHEHYKDRLFTDPIWRKAWIAAATLHAWKRLWD